MLELNSKMHTHKITTVNLFFTSVTAATDGTTRVQIKIIQSEQKNVAGIISDEEGVHAPLPLLHPSFNHFHHKSNSYFDALATSGLYYKNMTLVNGDRQ